MWLHRCCVCHATCEMLQCTNYIRSTYHIIYAFDPPHIQTYIHSYIRYTHTHFYSIGSLRSTCIIINLCGITASLEYSIYSLPCTICFGSQIYVQREWFFSASTIWTSERQRERERGWKRDESEKPYLWSIWHSDKHIEYLTRWPHFRTQSQPELETKPTKKIEFLC